MPPRIPLPHDRPNSLGVPDVTELFPSGWAAWRRAYVVLRELDSVDPVTKELVRIRNARRQKCELCMSLRSSDSLAAGADEETLEQVDHYEDSELLDLQKAALRLADAYLTPTPVSPALAREIRRQLSPDQIVEILLRLVHWSNNKVMVALGLDGDDLSRQVYDP